MRLATSLQQLAVAARRLDVEHKQKAIPDVCSVWILLDSIWTCAGGG